MRQKRRTTLLAMLLLLSVFPIWAYEGTVGIEAGWQIDSDGSITGTANTKFIWVNEANFPDENFRNILLTDMHSSLSFDNCNLNGCGTDDVLTEAEIATITGIDVNSKNIGSLKGIEFFFALTSLRCYRNQLTELSLAYNTALTSLNCSYNQLAELDITHNTALTYLECSYDQLTELDVTHNTALASLSCGSNQLTELDVTHNTALASLSCGSNQLTELDVTRNTALASLSCGSNQLTELDITHNTKLQDLRCTGNQLTELDVTHNAVLQYLYCSNNLLSELDVTHNVSLKILNCSFNQLSDLDITHNTALTSLNCVKNQLTNLNITKNIILNSLDCSMNELTELDVTQNTNLTSLTCYMNQLSTLDITQNTSLTSLKCYSNKLTALDVSRNTIIKTLSCGNNQLTELDVTNNTSLSTFQCPSNHLKSLDLSNNSQISVFSYLANVSGQTSTDEVVVLGNNRNMIGIYLPTGGEAENFQNFLVDGDMVNAAVESNNGKEYLIVAADEAKDIDLYKKRVTYQYNTGAASTCVSLMDVAITSSPYVMYIHPATMRDDFYSGTLYLDYPSKVPEGVECYYASSLTSDEQLNLVKIKGTIPANTGIYVKTPVPGYYAFYESDETPATIGTNVFTGSVTATAVSFRSVLTLGHENTTKELGFWNYAGGSVPAHRAYVPASVLKSIDAKGVKLHFPDGATTEVSKAWKSNDDNDNWITLQGIHLNGRPSIHGIYVNNGKKVIVK